MESHICENRADVGHPARGKDEHPGPRTTPLVQLRLGWGTRTGGVRPSAAEKIYLDFAYVWERRGLASVLNVCVDSTGVTLLGGCGCVDSAGVAATASRVRVAPGSK